MIKHGMISSAFSAIASHAANNLSDRLKQEGKAAINVIIMIRCIFTLE